MAVNADKPHLWKGDIAASVDMYNEWFLTYAPKAFRDSRAVSVVQVVSVLNSTKSLKSITPGAIIGNPEILQVLRMSTAPVIARDRLIGLSGVAPNLVKSLEEGHRLPPKMDRSVAEGYLKVVIGIFNRLVDKDIFTWLDKPNDPSEEETNRAATIVADRLSGAVSDPLIRNEQEKRQLAVIRDWLQSRGYVFQSSNSGLNLANMKSGTFAFHLNVPVTLAGQAVVNITVDVAIKPKDPQKPVVLIEAKSAGDFTNVNKRRKEEATKMIQLRQNYGTGVSFVLFLCGYFDSGYLGYEAAEGIDWVWEHRSDDLAQFGV